ncbi:MAG: tetratricopeptide repeat protein [Fibrobacteres bacterium]|nr:tetratricopeptide repeat protein [Fibrobacterota bacterium]
MLDKVWKRISDKGSSGKKLVPIILGLSAAMWLGAGVAIFCLKDKHTADSAKTEAKSNAVAATDEKGELTGVPASQANAEGSPATKAKEAPVSEAPEGKAAMSEAPAAENDPQMWPSRDEMAALRQVAELRAGAGELEEAVTPLRRVMRVPTHEATLLALAAKVFLGTANYAEAFWFASQLVGLEPENMRARVQSVEAQYRMGQVEPAMRSAEAALKRHPGDLAMLVELGTMQVEAGPAAKGYGDALAAALKLKPDYAPALYLMGRKAQLEGDFKDAETAFAKVVKLDPENVKALGQLGMAQYHLGKMIAAEKSYRLELARNQSDYNTWYNLGELLLGNANEETNSEAVRRFRAAAMECYLKAIDLNPEHAQARYRVGVLLIGNGQYKEAIRHLEAALRLDSRHVPTLVQLSLAYENLKQRERARAYLNKAYELDPLNKIVLSKLRRMS